MLCRFRVSFSVVSRLLWSTAACTARSQTWLRLPRRSVEPVVSLWYAANYRWTWRRYETRRPCVYIGDIPQHQKYDFYNAFVKRSKVVTTHTDKRLQRSYGLDGVVMSWFTSYLAGCTQCLRSSASSSTPSAVLQRSVLGPILFLLYIGDVLLLVNSHHHMHMLIIRKSTLL